MREREESLEMIWWWCRHINTDIDISQGFLKNKGMNCSLVHADILRGESSHTTEEPETIITTNKENVTFLCVCVLQFLKIKKWKYS